MNVETIINWMNNETMRSSVYHDHKENMMWAGFALYLSGFTALAVWLNGENTQISYKGWWYTGTAVITAFTIFFLWWQFYNREIAGNKVEGLIRVTNELLQEKFNFSWDAWYFNKRLKLPKFIADNVPNHLRICTNFLPYLLSVLISCGLLLFFIYNK